MPKVAPAKKSVKIVEDAELKPCPFCGEQANLKTDISGLIVAAGGKRIEGTSYFWAKCSNQECAISTRSVSSQSLASDLWNNRA